MNNHNKPLLYPSSSPILAEKLENEEAFHSWRQEQLNAGNPNIQLTKTFGRRSVTLKRLQKVKTVGFGAGIALLINNLTGLGLAMTPGLFQQSGWLFSTLCFIGFCILSTLSALFVIEAMQRIPGNRHFQGSVEFGTLINFYFENPTTHMIGQIVLYCALQSVNAASIVVCFQQFDSLMIEVFGRTCGMTRPFGFACSNAFPEGYNSAFGPTPLWFTFGTLLTILALIPLADMDTDDNMTIQVGSCALVFVIVGQWIWSFLSHGLDTALVPAIRGNPATIPGLVMLNYAFVVTVPQFINTKEKSVNVQWSLWTSTIISTLLYIVLGLLGGMSLPGASNLLVALQTSSPTPFLRFLSKITGYVFTVAVLMSGIPVNSMVVKNNLVQNNVFSEKVSEFLATIMPFIVAIPLQTGNLVNNFTNWSSLIFGSASNLLIPFIIYIQSAKFRKDYDASKQLTQHQRDLLRVIHDNSRSIQRFLDRADTHQRFELLSRRDRSDTSSTHDTDPLLENISETPTVVGGPSEIVMGSLKRRGARKNTENWFSDHAIQATDGDDVASEDLDGVHHFPALEKYLTNSGDRHNRSMSLGREIEVDGTEYPVDGPNEEDKTVYPPDTTDKTEYPMETDSSQFVNSLPVQGPVEGDMPAPMPNISKTLPRNPLFTGPAFHALPENTIDSLSLAKRCLQITSALIGYCVLYFAKEVALGHDPFE